MFCYLSDPTIILPLEVVFPIEQGSGNFIVKVITTERLTHFNIERSDGEMLERSAILTKFLSYDPQIALYRVAFPWLVTHLSGRYTVKVTNAAKRSATTKLHLIVSTGE